jgi:phosphate acetyltransferase
MLDSPTETSALSAASHPHLDAIIAAARLRGAVPVAVAWPGDAASIRAAVLAQQAGLIEPILVGPATLIRAAADAAGLDLYACRLQETANDPRAAAAQAAALARDGRARALMKGSLHSDELLAAVVTREAGLRGARRVSHAFVFDVPSVDRLLMLTDCVVNIAPDLLAKRDIVQNAIELAHALGIAKPNVALLSAVETVNPAIPGTIDAAALCKMADRGQITGAVLDGPLAFDNAISAASARNKGIASLVAGCPDILLVPSLEAGNMLYKQLVYLAAAECAGVVLGLRVPIVLASRSDSVASRVASCALAVLASTQCDTASALAMGSAA